MVPASAPEPTIDEIAAQIFGADAPVAPAAEAKAPAPVVEAKPDPVAEKVSARLEVAKRAARYYIGIEDWPNVVRFMEDVVAAEPENMPQQYDLAKAKWLAGDTAGAREIVERLKVDAPVSERTC